MTELDEWPPRKARTTEDWDAYWDRQRWDRRLMRRVIRPRLARLRRKLAAPFGWKRRARHAVHRARHGWAAPDTWSLDDYIATLLGESVAWLRDHGHGYPCDHYEPDAPPCTCETDWNETLTKISNPLLAYKTHWDWPDGQVVAEHWEIEKKIIADAQGALRLMADHLPSLWD